MFDLPDDPDQFERILRPIAHRSPSANKYRSFERYLGELLDLNPEDIYTSYVSKPGNYSVRMGQSDRALQAKLYVALVPNAPDIDRVKNVSSRIATEKHPGSSAMVIYDDGGRWVPIWGTEPESAEYLTPIKIKFPNFQISFYSLSAYNHLTEQEKLKILKTLLETGPIEPWIRLLRSRPEAIQSMYRMNPAIFTRPIEEDVGASDVIAIAHRREVVDHFRRLLDEPSFFEEKVRELGDRQNRREAVWQKLLEDNPWILGVGLAGQILTGWDRAKLEKVVAGFSIKGPGKRVDALMHTNGRIRALVFAEIKTHQTELLGGKYRAGCYAPSEELAGAVTQIQQTVHHATRQIGEKLADKDADGADTGENTYLVRPRSYLVIGNLAELRGASGVHQEKYESFELYRRNLYEPEIITFDELLSRAQWHVQALGD